MNTWHRFVDTAGRSLAQLIVRFYYPRIEVDSADPLPEDAQILFVANHANSLIDPVIMSLATRRRIHFLAKAPLFDIPVLGQIMKAFGMIPVFRSVDDKSQMRQNLKSLEVAAQHLADGRDVGVFPEGKSHDDPRVEPVHSGAARIAVKASKSGKRRVYIVPVGMNYERKERFRSGVWVRMGPAIDVGASLESHEGNERNATRSLTAEIDRSLKAVVIHLDSAAWAAHLNILESLGPASGESSKDPISALRHRKRLADGINSFMKEDPERTKAMGVAMLTHRERLAQEGLTVRSPMVRFRSLWASLFLLRQMLFLLGVIFPWLGAFFHLVPFLIVRFSAGRLSPPGNMATAMYRLFVGIPIYALWYFLMWRWLAGYFLPWVAWTVAAVMPFLGIWALDYCRRVRDSAKLWWSESRILFRRAKLIELRTEQRRLGEELEEMSQEYRRQNPFTSAPRIQESRLISARKCTIWFGSVGVAVVLLVFAYSWFRPVTILELSSASPDLSNQTAQTLEIPLETDEEVLSQILTELDRLGLRAAEMRARFESGGINFYRQADNDAIRQSLMTYIACRSAMLRITWKYQNFHQIEDQKSRLRAQLLALTAATSTYNASLILVTDFINSPEAVKKLNESEPVWGVPEGLFDQIHRNLLEPGFRDQLNAAVEDYRGLALEFGSTDLDGALPYRRFHERIAANTKRIDELHPRLDGTQFEITLKEARKIGDEGIYGVQTFISYWIGQARFRAPRDGQSLIRVDDCAELQPQLRPGDILIERRNWVLSNAFLPGFWSHAALYVGTPDEIEAMGLRDDPRVQSHWAEFSSPDREDHSRVIIEALAAGVIFTSIEHSVGEADAVAVFRPVLSDADRRECIARAFSHLGKPYDFEFDFFSTDKLVCTELIYRAYDGKIDFSLVEVMGTTTMPAMNVIRKFENERGAANAQLEFISFIDGDEEAGSASFKDAEELIRSLNRSSFTWMQ